MVSYLLRKGCEQGYAIFQLYQIQVDDNIIQLKLMKKPFDLELILGDDNTGKEIASLNVEFELKASQIQKVCQKTELREQVGKDLIFKFDFTTQEGRQKEAIEYFESGLDFDEKDEYDHSLSPLQNWFKRPKKSGKLDLYESTRTEGSGRVTLEYRIYYQQIQQEEEELLEMVEQFGKSDFHPDLNLSMTFFGNIEMPKKNRIKLKMDYIDIHLTSQEFKMKEFQNLLKLMKFFGEEENEVEEIVSNPLFKFLHNTEELQAKIKLASARKILRLYEIGITEENTIKQKKTQHPDVIKGLFKQQVRVTFIYSNSLAFIATYRYRSQAVFIRMLTGIKKYLKYFD